MEHSQRSTRSSADHSDAGTPPGDFPQERLHDLGISQVELARRLGRPRQVVNEIVRGKNAITAETALDLEAVLTTPAHIWLGLEQEYRLVLARRARAEVRP
ncbi:MAG: HigA family addiction module antitoxin [Chloroflexi bacterium]|nr:HigA family addiction module antitoxin [Chloroflexota bacterium]